MCLNDISISFRIQNYYIFPIPATFFAEKVINSSTKFVKTENTSNS